MTNFTKIRFAGEDFVLITNRDRYERPLLMLNKDDIKRLNKEMYL